MVIYFEWIYKTNSKLRTEFGVCLWELTLSQNPRLKVTSCLDILVSSLQLTRSSVLLQLLLQFNSTLQWFLREVLSFCLSDWFMPVHVPAMTRDQLNKYFWIDSIEKDCQLISHWFEHPELCGEGRVTPSDSILIHKHHKKSTWLLSPISRQSMVA